MDMSSGSIKVGKVGLIDILVDSVPVSYLVLNSLEFVDIGRR